MSRIVLSICIVNWNMRDLLRQCLRSILAPEPDPTIEVIVVDNASSDGSADMVAREFPGVILARNDTNRSFAPGCNQAAALSRGRYLLFLNNDTIVDRASLHRLVDFLEAHPEVGMVGPRLLGADGRPQRSYRPRPTLAAILNRIPLMRWTGLFQSAYQRYRHEPFDSSSQQPVETLLGAAVCLPRHVFFGHHGWDENFYFGLEDFDLSLRVARTHEIVYFPDAEIVHFGKMSTRRNSGFAYIGLECGYARFLRKHSLGPLGLWIYKLLFTVSLPFGLAIESFRVGLRMVRRRVKRRLKDQLGPLWYFTTRGLIAFWRA
jgi:GT2 family glycosyltransferase